MFRWQLAISVSVAVSYQCKSLSVAVGYHEFESLSVAVSYSVELLIAAGYLAISSSGLQIIEMEEEFMLLLRKQFILMEKISTIGNFEWKFSYESTM